jgi:alkyl hydroperoxide reductase subunit AhpC
MFIDIIVGILCAWISYRLMQRREESNPHIRGSPYYNVVKRDIRLEIQKPLESVYLVYHDHDFVFQCTNIDDLAKGIYDKYSSNGMHFTFLNKDKEVPEKEWRHLYKTLEEMFNK